MASVRKPVLRTHSAVGIHDFSESNSQVHNQLGRWLSSSPESESQARFSGNRSNGAPVAISKVSVAPIADFTEKMKSV